LIQFPDQHLFSHDEGAAVNNNRYLYFFKIFIFFTILSISSIIARPYFDENFFFYQPDGTKVQVILSGDEFFLKASTPDGKPVVRDQSTGWICYAETANDSLISTRVPYLSNDISAKKGPSTAPEKNELSQTTINIIRKRNFEQLYQSNIPDYMKSLSGMSKQTVADSMPVKKRPASYFSGTVNGLVVVWDFSDEPITKSYSSTEAALAALDKKFNSLTPSDKSLRYQFRKFSGDKFDLIYIIKGVYRAPNTFQYYDKEMSYGEGHNLLLKSALEKLKSEGFDFTALSPKTDNKTIRGLCISTTGNPSTWAQGMWAHAGWVNFSFDANGRKPGQYCTTSETGDALTHEQGHLIGEWPDLYSSTGKETGTWDLMGGGYTDLPNPYFLYLNSWLTASNLSKELPGQIIKANGTNANTGHIYYLSTKPDNFFFIKPYTKKLPFCTSLPDEGLTIWRINKLGDNFAYPNKPLHVELIHANNTITNKTTNVCFKSSGVSTINDNTTPHCRWSDNTPSGLGLLSISKSDTVMQFQLKYSQLYLKITSTPGGTVTPVGQIEIAPLSNKTIKINPNTGYQIKEILVDGAKVANTDSIVFSSINSSHVVNVTFSSSTNISYSNSNIDLKNRISFTSNQNMVRLKLPAIDISSTGFVQVSSLNGKLIKQFNLRQQNQTAEINSARKGIYIIRAFTNNKLTYTGRISVVQ
jgi:M6 family metalloprotease-like protein